MVPFKIDLSRKVAAVTGGGGVLCGAFAEALAECGAKVAVLSLHKESADKVADRINAAGGTAMGLAANVLEAEELDAARKTIEDTWGPVGILINGAGGNHPKGTTSKEYLFSDQLKGKVEGLTTFFDLDPEGIQYVFNLNFLGTLLSTQIFSRGMAEAGSGVIINVSSMNAYTPLTKIPAYSGAKAAVSNFTRWLAVHFSKVGVRVNAIAPGFFLTNQNRGLLTQDDGSWTPRAKTILNHIPQDRLGSPEDLIGTLLWLVDEKAAGYVNGTVIPVDGGFSAFSGV
jgi:NAD(P)-dependent dehydrogenase (short-subunit alcohol dehydrogenase family)